MRNILLTCVLLLGSWCYSSAQATYKFTFEDAIPEQWKANQGTFSLSEDHFAEGLKSLCWEAPANQESSFTVSFTGFATGSFASFFNIYSLAATNNLLKVEFLDASNVTKKIANVTINFKGWRDFNRVYGKDFSSKLAATIASVRFTLDNKLSVPQKIFIDNVNFKASTDNSRQAQDLMVLDVGNMESGKAILLKMYANPVDIKSVEPTAEELTSYEILKKVYGRIPAAAPSPTELRTVRSYINSLNITRNEDETVKGDVMPSSPSDLTKNFMLDIVKKLEYIAAAGKSSESDKQLFNDFLDYIIDQGFVYKFPQLTYSDYSTVRELPASLMDILPVCSDAQRIEVLKMANWMIEYGFVYAPRAYYSINLSSDYIYHFFPYLYTYAIYQLNPKDAVRELKALTRFIERTMETNPGSDDILKPDGLGFHHNTHYNNYMYAYSGWMTAISKLKGTPFRISEEAYNQFKKAVWAMYMMSNKMNLYTANSLCGRHPIVGGNENQFSKALLELLIEVGGDILGKEKDDELASLYDYFFGNKYDAPVVDFGGYYQFNYSPIGVYRRDNWTATMRAPTTKFWGAEIYSGTNRFGRYQSHGTLEIVYDGNILNSGLPTIAQGWDWNVVPGATTVHYTSWKEMMPNKNTTDRFDQYTKTKNFAGALAWNDCGIFASDFDQIDKWGGQRFTPTNLEFKKSVYSFDGMLISLGTNIKSSGSYGADMITATNLFQEVDGGLSGELNINGQVMAAGSASQEKTTTDDFWMVTPRGTGYFVAKGNDKVIIKYGEQQGPHETGKDVNAPAKSTAAKAYITHGVKPTDKEYLFVVVPATTPDKMQTLSQKLKNDGGDLFEIKSRTDKFHALTYKPEGITAYSFFEAIPSINFGIVQAVGSEMLLMQKTLTDTRVSFAVTNPNLRPVTVSDSHWKASTTETSITINGEWYEDIPVSGVTVDAPSNGRTVVRLSLNDGLPAYFNLKPEGYVSSINTAKKNDWVKIFANNNEIVVELNDVFEDTTTIDLYTVDGLKIQSRTLEAGISRAVLKTTKGICMVRVKNGNKVRTLKCVL